MPKARVARQAGIEPTLPGHYARWVTTPRCRISFKPSPLGKVARRLCAVTDEVPCRNCAGARHGGVKTVEGAAAYGLRLIESIRRSGLCPKPVEGGAGIEPATLRCAHERTS